MNLRALCDLEAIGVGGGPGSASRTTPNPNFGGSLGASPSKPNRLNVLELVSVSECKQ